MAAVVKAIEKVVTTVVDTVKAVIKDPLPTIAAAAGQLIGIPAPITAAAITAARGGDLGDIAKSATIAYVAPQAASTVAQNIAPTVSSVVSNPTAAAAVTRATSAALVNGSVAAATGGDFSQAASGTFAGSMVASGYQNYVAPDVMAKAQELGLTPEQAAKTSGVLRTATGVGTAAAVGGGDFATSFGAAIGEQIADIGMDNVRDAVGNVLKKDGVKQTAASDAGVPSVAINDVPVSPNAQPGIVANADGKAIGEINPDTSSDAYDQVLSAFSQPKSPGVGTQLGVPTASLTPVYQEDIEGQPVAGTEIVVTPEPSRLAPSAYESQVLDEAKRDIFAKPTGVTPIDTAPVTSEAKQSYEDLRRLYAASTGVLPSDLSPTAGYAQPSVLSSAAGTSDYAQLESSAQDAQVRAMQDPTPENLQAAQEAQMNLELAKSSQGTESGQQFPLSVSGEATGIPSDWEIPSVDQLPMVEVTGEMPEEPLTDEEWAQIYGVMEPDQYVGQQFPISITGEPTGVRRSMNLSLPQVSAQTSGFRRASPLSMSLLQQKQRQLLGDLGAGIVFTGGLPTELLQPSMLARGGLIRLKKV